MRFILQAILPPEKFNRMALEGAVSQKLNRILEETKPEAAYFVAIEGKRCAMLVINMESASEIPKYAEPWFINFDAEVNFMPAMIPDDLKKAGLEEVVRKWK